MKTKILISLVFLITLMATFTITNKSSKFEKVGGLFIMSDNIAYAEEGYTCAPASWYNICHLPNNGGGIQGYIKRT